MPGKFASPLFVGGVFAYLVARAVWTLELRGPLAVLALMIGGAVIAGITAVWVWSVRLSRFPPS